MMYYIIEWKKDKTFIGRFIIEFDTPCCGKPGKYVQEIINVIKKLRNTCEYTLTSKLHLALVSELDSHPVKLSYYLSSSGKFRNRVFEDHLLKLMSGKTLAWYFTIT